jgi:hypothetical protein
MEQRVAARLKDGEVRTSAPRGRSSSGQCASRMEQFTAACLKDGAVRGSTPRGRSNSGRCASERSILRMKQHAVARLKDGAVRDSVPQGQSSSGRRAVARVRVEQLGDGTSHDSVRRGGAAHDSSRMGWRSMCRGVSVSGDGIKRQQMKPIIFMERSGSAYSLFRDGSAARSSKREESLRSGWLRSFL